MLKGKHEVSLQVLNFISLVEKQFSIFVKIVRTDNGPEFTLSSYYGSKGIEHQTNCREIPE